MNKGLLIDLSPLLIATLHGYGAAWLAVKMLFRPHQPIYIFGKRLPLTPGMLPKERERFIDAVSRVVSERLLTVETITDELMRIGLEAEIEAITRQQYEQHSQNSAVLKVITRSLKKALEELRGREEIKHQITLELMKIIDAELIREYGLLRRTIANLFIEGPFIYRIVDSAIKELVDEIEESIYLRETVQQAMLQIPETVLKNGAMVEDNAAARLVTTLGQRLNFYDILKRRLRSFPNELIEELVMETAGREIRAIIWFGAMIGFLIGIFQTAINFIG